MNRSLPGGRRRRMEMWAYGEHLIYAVMIIDAFGDMGVWIGCVCGHQAHLHLDEDEAALVEMEALGHVDPAETSASH